MLNFIFYILLPIHLTFATALGKPFALHGQVTRDDGLTASSSGKWLDKFKDSGLEFDQWLGLMIQDGHLHHPNSSSAYGDDGKRGVMVLLVERDGWYIQLQNIGCTGLSGSRDLIADAEEPVCDFVNSVAQLYISEVETDVQQIVCNNNRICRLSMKVVFNFVKLFEAVGDITDACHNMFDALNNACPDGGGVAEVVVNDGAGNSNTGQIESAYSLENGPPCQPSTTLQCLDKSEL